MGNLVENLKNKISLTRRSFMKSAAVAGAAALYGCVKNYGGNVMPGNEQKTSLEETGPSTFIYGASTHNCGGRCVSRAEVKNGRIVRIFTDESLTSGDGSLLDTSSRNLPQTRSCSRCRGYRYRVHHPGRLMYPMVQTKQRGDLNGFKRISWQEAYTNIAKKHKAVMDKYGLDGIYVLYDSSANAGVQGRDACEAAYRYMGYKEGAGYEDGLGGHWKDQFGTYSTHQNSYMGIGYTGVNSNLTANELAKYTKTLVLWGDNAATTYNNSVYALANLADDFKKNDAKVYFIGPSFSDEGIILADEWLAAKSYTDVALIAGMIYHMLDNTFDLSTGALKADPWLDVDYLDTMVYGFFDSPAYKLDEESGEIGTPEGKNPNAYQKAGTDKKAWRNILAVEPGKSYCSWILGNNNKAPLYSATSTNYTAKQFADVCGNPKRWSPCTYPNSKNSVYGTKRDCLKPKTPAWAAAITGVDEQAIKDLAKRFCKNKPVTSIWSGGQQKQADGCVNLLAVQALQVITGNAGEYGASFGRVGPTISTLTNPVGALGNITNFNIAKKTPQSPQRPTASCTAWHTIIKLAFADELLQELPNKPAYTAKYIPNFPKKNGKPDLKKAYWDDGGTKAAAVQWKRSVKDIVIDKDKGTTAKRLMVDTYKEDGKDYFKWEGMDEGKMPVYAGIRLMYNSASNIVINQHENSNDSAEMMRCLKLNDASADTFCLVTFDNFMSPTARYSDYVLPASTAWEHQNYIAPNHTAGFFVPQAVTPPGESEQAFDFGKKLLLAYEKEVQDKAPKAVGIAANYAGGNVNNTIESIAKERYFADDGPFKNPKSPFYQKAWEEYIKNPVLLKKPDDNKIAEPVGYKVKDAYKKADKLKPFICTARSITTNGRNKVGYEVYGTNSKGNPADIYADRNAAPNTSLRYHVYSRMLTWGYESMFDKWNGFLPADERGQQHKDLEGDRFVLEIPIYYDYRDYYVEAYAMTLDQIKEKLPFCLTTTHDKYRSHSSLAESPMMRELYGKVPGLDEKGKLKSGNDFNEYAMGPAQNLARTIEADGSVKDKNKNIATYTEVWVNRADMGKLGIKDGDLVQIENPIGAVRCVARLSDRCARGYIDLHQGCWYDPREIPNNGSQFGHTSVDVGGNCNTLMASQPSRIDHGNGQQSALVNIFKVK